MLRGLYDGKGILYNKLNTYNGDFKQGKMHGYGIMTINPGLKNQVTYSGYWRDDQLLNGGTRTD